MLLQHMQTKSVDKKIQLATYCNTYFHPHPLMFTLLIYLLVLLVHQASCLWRRKGTPLWMCLATDDQSQEGRAVSWSLGPECQNSCYVSIPGPGLCSLQELCSWLQPSTIKWDSQAYRRCPAASLIVPALYSGEKSRLQRILGNAGSQRCSLHGVSELGQPCCSECHVVVQQMKPWKDGASELSSINPKQLLVCMSLAISAPWCVFCMLNLCVWGQRKCVWESTSVHAISDKCQAVLLSNPTLKTIKMHGKPVCAVNNPKRDNLVPLATG